MIPTVSKPGLTAEQAPYLGIAQQCLHRLKLARGTLNTLYGVWELANGVKIYASICYNYEAVSIYVPPSVLVTTEIVGEKVFRGFITHPRNGTVRGFQFPGHDSMRTFTYGTAHTGIGYKLDENKDVVDEGDFVGAQEGNPFPLNGEEGRIYHFSVTDGKWAAKGPQKLLYGNVDWKGPVTTNPKKRKILTYKGNPSRYWPVGQFVEIPGLSSVDHFVDGTLSSYEYMTVFGDKVYEGGEVLATMPLLYHPLNTTTGGTEASHQNAQVLGAAYRESDGVLICIVKTCYNSYPRLKGVAGTPDFTVSAWHVYKDGIIYADYLDDKAAADKFIADNPSQGYSLVEFTDPGRGYFFEVLLNKSKDVIGGWTRLLRQTTGSNMPDCNFFFSEDGTKSCSVMFGKLNLIEITGDTATYTEQSLGGFKNEIKTDNDSVQESNYGEPDPTKSGIFAQVYRVGIKSGDWITRTDTIKKYTSDKTGTLTLAADYKGNVLTKMDATLTGSEVYDYYRRMGFKWGYTALPPSLHSADSDRTPTIRVEADPFNELGVPTGSWCVGLGGVCKPKVTLQGLGTALETNQKCATYEICEINSKQTLMLAASVIDEAGGRAATVTKEYTITPKNLSGPWTTVFSSSCGTGVSTGYKFSGKWYRVTYGTSNIPVSAVIGSLGELAVEHAEQRQLCNNGTMFTTYWMDTATSAIGKYFSTPSGLRPCTSGGPAGWLSGCESDGTWDKYWWYSSTGVEVRSTNWECYDRYACTEKNTYAFSYARYNFGAVVCDDFASDSYLSGLVDLNGNPITITETTYKIKVFKVEEPC